MKREEEPGGFLKHTSQKSIGWITQIFISGEKFPSSTTGNEHNYRIKYASWVIWWPSVKMMHADDSMEYYSALGIMLCFLSVMTFLKQTYIEGKSQVPVCSNV